MKNPKILIISRPFNIQKYRFKENVHFCFTLNSDDHLSSFYHDIFDQIFFEKSLNLNDLPEKAIPIEDISFLSLTTYPKVIFTPSSDTHCQLFETVNINPKIEIIYAIPPKHQKDEKALESLAEIGVDPVIINYGQEDCDELNQFAPDFAICGNDWCTEYNTINKILKKDKAFSYLSIQEGPQDWHALIEGKKPRKYLNTDFLFSQGPVTIRYIQPQFFSNTGVPKTDGFTEVPLPQTPKVFINLNFTYDNWEVDRNQWLKDCTEACNELEIDYLISQHPRDNGIVNDPKLQTSSAYKVVDQLKACSISISRFSTIPLETLRVGRHSIYYNPHKETPRSYNEDTTQGIYKAFDKSELKRNLSEHINNYKFNRLNALKSLEYHASIQNGQSPYRITEVLIAMHQRDIIRESVINNYIEKD